MEETDSKVLYWIMANLNFNKLKCKEYFKHRVRFESRDREKFDQASKICFCCLCLLGYHLLIFLFSFPSPLPPLVTSNRLMLLITRHDLLET